MKLNLIVIENMSDVEFARESMANRRAVAFIFENVDPKHQLGFHEFLYVQSFDEVNEKFALINADPEIAYEVLS